MKVLAIIPARSGSKSIRDKNLSLWRGQSLLAHSIIHGLAAQTVDRVLVSTDSEAYAEIAKSLGADVPFLRPAEFSGDHSTDLEVFQHALSWLAENEGYRPDICVHLRPTYPSRAAALIDKMVGHLAAHPDLDAVRTVVPVVETPYKTWFRDPDGNLSPVVQFGDKESWNIPRQQLPVAYWQNACIDVVRTSVILEKNSMTGRRIYGYVMPEAERFDIDTPGDLARLDEKTRTLATGRPLVFCFDVDGIIATLVPDNDYAKAGPVRTTIELINRLFDAGHHIVIFTARGSATGLDWSSVTKDQMRIWGVKYHELRFGKPAADVYIDDKFLPLSEVHQMLL
jgi:CMP-N,N'-diacetyllegionaminic acid synthase